MADTVKFSFRYSKKGFNAIRNGAPMQAECLRVAQGIGAEAAKQSGGSYESDVQTGRARCHAIVHAADYAAMLDEARHNTLKKVSGC